MTSWSSSIKIWFLKTYSMHYKKKKCHGVKQKCKNMPLVKQNVMKFENFILGGQRNDQKRIRDGGEGEREDRDGSRERIEIVRKETKGN